MVSTAATATACPTAIPVEPVVGDVGPGYCRLAGYIGKVGEEGRGGLSDAGERLFLHRGSKIRIAQVTVLHRVGGES